jgi:PAS domain S-box-containing protein
VSRNTRPSGSRSEKDHPPLPGPDLKRGTDPNRLPMPPPGPFPSDQALRESEERYRRLVEHSPLAIAVHVDGRVVYANPATLRLIGAERPEQLVGKPVLDFVADSSKEVVVARIKMSLETGRAAPVTPEKFIRLDGRIIDVEVTALPIRYGDASGMQVIFIDVTERKAAEEALVRSEAKYRSLFENFVVGVFRTSPEGRLLEANAAFAAMYGYESPEAMVAQVNDVASQLYVSAEDRTDVLRTLQEKGVIAGRELRTRRRDGTLFWIALAGRAVRDDKGEVLYFEGTVLDITAKKQQEEQLLRINRLYRTLQDAGELIVDCHDSQSLFEGACRILTESGGFRLAWIGLKMEDGTVLVVAGAGPAAEYLKTLRVRWDDTPEGRGPTGTAIREGRSVIISDLAANPDYAPWLSKTTPLGLRSSGAFPLFEADKVIGAVSIYVDQPGFIGPEEQAPVEKLAADLSFALQSQASEEQRRAADQALLESEEKFRSALENLDEIVYVADCEGVVRFVSPAIQRILGYSPEEVIGRTVLDFVHSGEVELARRRREQLNAGRPTKSELRILARDGSERWMASASQPLRRGGEIVGYQGVLRDITAAKKAEEELDRHRRNLERLVQERTEALSDARAAALNLMQDSELQRAEIERTLAESRRMEAALRESEDSLRRILQTTNEGFWRIDTQAVTLEVNKALCGLLGRPREDLLGRPVYDFLDPENARVFREELARRAHGFHGSYEITLKRPDGQSVVCHFNGTPLYDPQDIYCGSFAMVTDITRRKMAEEELRRRTEELEAFNRAMVDREMKIIEMKEEVNRLCLELGRPEAYPPVWNREPGSRLEPRK